MKTKVKPDICYIFDKETRPKNLNKRQQALIDAYYAFLEEQPPDFDLCINEIPDLFNRLLEISNIS